MKFTENRSVDFEWNWTRAFEQLLANFGLLISFVEYTRVPSSTRRSIAVRAKELFPYFNAGTSVNREAISTFLSRMIGEDALEEIGLELHASPPPRDPSLWSSQPSSHDQFVSQQPLLPYVVDLTPNRLYHLHLDTLILTPLPTPHPSNLNKRKRRMSNGENPPKPDNVSRPSKIRDRMSLHSLLHADTDSGRTKKQHTVSVEE